MNREWCGQCLYIQQGAYTTVLLRPPVCMYWEVDWGLCNVMNIVPILLLMWQLYICVVFLITVLSLIKIFLLLGIRV